VVLPLGHGLEVCRVWAQSGPWCWHCRRAETGQTGVFFVTWAAPTLKLLVDWAVLGACHRCSPLPQTNGKLVCMVWGRQDHYCDRQVLSAHTKLAPAANSGARFCSKVVGASTEALHSDLISSRFRAWSRGLQSLGAIRPMVLALQARRNGSNRGFVAPSLQSPHLAHF
jgi:hypothetical protein